MALELLWRHLVFVKAYQQTIQQTDKAIVTSFILIILIGPPGEDEPTTKYERASVPGLMIAKY